jgi:hypothetical protein
MVVGGEGRRRVCGVQDDVERLRPPANAILWGFPLVTEMFDRVFGAYR